VQLFIIFIRCKSSIVLIESNIKLVNRVDIEAKIKVEVEVSKNIYFFALNISLLSKELLSLLSSIILYRHLI